MIPFDPALLVIALPVAGAAWLTFGVRAADRLTLGTQRPARRPGAQTGFTPWEFQVDYDDVVLTTVEGLSFAAWHFRQPGSPQAVIIAPPQGVGREALLGVAVSLWRKGFNVLLYEAATPVGGHSNLGIGAVHEIQSVVRFIRQRIVGPRIGLLGFGTGAVSGVLEAAGEPSLEALVLDGAFADPLLLARQQCRRSGPLPPGWVLPLVRWIFRRRTGCRLEEASTLAVVHALQPRPVFLIHGATDSEIPVGHSRLLNDRYRGPRELWVVQGAGQMGSYPADREVYTERVAGFFSRHLGLKVSGALRLVEEEDAG